MESNCGEETFEFVSRWLDDVGEAAPALTTQPEVTPKQPRQQQQTPHLPPGAYHFRSKHLHN